MYLIGKLNIFASTLFVFEVKFLKRMPCFKGRKMLKIPRVPLFYIFKAACLVTGD